MEKEKITSTNAQTAAPTATKMVAPARIHVRIQGSFSREIPA
jgi:hypothetical protein